MSAPASQPQADPADSIRRNAAFGLGVKLSGAVLTGALTLFLVRALDPDGYGVFVLALSVGSVALLFSDFGISQSAARFIAERRGDRSLIGDVLSDALSLKLAGSTLASVALFLAAEPIASAYDNNDLIWPLRLVAIAVLGQSLLNLFAGSFEALGRNSLGFRLVLSESAVEAGASVALVLLGAGATGAAGGRAIGFCFGGLLGIAMAVRAIRPGRIAAGPRARFGYRSIAGYAGALLVIEGAFALYTEIDTLLIGIIIGTSAAGLFGAPLKLLIFAQYPGSALAAGVAPRLARHRDHPPNVGALRTAVRLLIVFQFALAPALVVWAEPLVRLVLGTDYLPSIDVVRLLAPYVLLSGLAPLLSLAVNYAGEARRRVPLALLTVAINAGLDVILINSMGIKGAAIATDVAIFFYVAGHLWICRDVFGLRLAPVAATLVRSALAAAAMGGVLWLFGTSSLSIVAAVAGLAAGAVVYCLAIVATGEFSGSELRLAGRAVRSALSSGPPVAAPTAAPPSAPDSEIADYVQGTGPSLRRLPGFLLLHAYCGGGFDVTSVGEPGSGRFRTTCLGCGKTFDYEVPSNSETSAR